MDPFYIQTDLSPAEVRRLADCAKSQASKAIAQHKEGVRMAVEELEKILNSFGGMLENASGVPWGIGLASVPSLDEKIILQHRVFLVENAGAAQTGMIALPIEITTTRFAKEKSPGVWLTGYRTVGVSHVPDDVLGECVSSTIPTVEFCEEF